jgi:hypothetical protein
MRASIGYNCGKTDHSHRNWGGYQSELCMKSYVITVLERGESWDLRLKTRTRRIFILYLVISISDHRMDPRILLKRHISWQQSKLPFELRRSKQITPIISDDYVQRAGCAPLEAQSRRNQNFTTATRRPLHRPRATARKVRDLRQEILPISKSSLPKYLDTQFDRIFADIHETKLPFLPEGAIPSTHRPGHGRSRSYPKQPTV